MRKLFLCVAAAACGGGGNDVPAAVDAAALPEGWQPLMQGDWTLGPGEEGYYCTYVTLTADTDIAAFRPLSPRGTHHTVMTKITSSTPADGTYRCNVSTNGTTMIYGSGVGAPDFEFPAGVGLRLPAGTRLLLNLHLYNASDLPLSGRSGALIKPPSTAIQNFAELVLAGPTIGLSVPTGTSTQQGSCMIERITTKPIQVFALSQHMHKLGTHMRSVVTRAGSPDIVLQDIAYDFEEQKFHHTDQLVELRPGDTLTTHCTFNNTTGQTVGFGESSDDEMCFTDLYYYPAQGASYICSGF
ncbi:MAG TPA: hypothetical protein VK427_17005 [Kofleriaceae bacterium]|nr:hypothetical protein [Kofleriaceae bacterium]